MLQTKKGESLVESTLAYVIIFSLFIVIMFGFVYTQKNNSLLEGQKYSYQIASAIDSAKVGDVISLDIQRLSEIVYKNEILNVQDLVTFNNELQLVSVKVSSRTIVNYPYLHDYEIKDVQYSVSPSGNMITFTIGDKNG